MTYETLVEKIQFLGYHIHTKPELGPELVRLQKLRKTYLVIPFLLGIYIIAQQNET